MKNIDDYKDRLREFEEKYGMSFEEATKRFERGDIGDGWKAHEAYFEWIFLKRPRKEGR